MLFDFWLVMALASLLLTIGGAVVLLRRDDWTMHANLSDVVLFLMGFAFSAFSAAGAPNLDFISSGATYTYTGLWAFTLFFWAFGIIDLVFTITCIFSSMNQQRQTQGY